MAFVAVTTQPAGLAIPPAPATTNPTLQVIGRLVRLEGQRSLLMSGGVVMSDENCDEN